MDERSHYAMPVKSSFKFRGVRGPSRLRDFVRGDSTSRNLPFPSPLYTFSLLHYLVLIPHLFLLHTLPCPRLWTTLSALLTISSLSTISKSSMPAKGKCSFLYSHWTRSLTDWVIPSTTLQAEPILGGKKLDLYKIFKAVIDAGGFDQVRDFLLGDLGDWMGLYTRLPRVVAGNTWEMHSTFQVHARIVLIFWKESIFETW